MTRFFVWPILISSLCLFGCMDSASYTNADQRTEIYKRFVNAFDSVTRTKGSIDTKIELGPIYTALVGAAAPYNLEPDWTYLGEIEQCAIGLCLVNGGASSQLSDVKASSGIVTGNQYDVSGGDFQSQTNIYNGFAAVERGDRGYIALKTWYQTNDQRASATATYKNFATSLSSLYSKAGSSSQADAFIGALSNVAKGYAGSAGGMCLPGDNSPYPHCEIGLSTPAP